MNRTLYIIILSFVALGVGIFLTWPKYQEFQVLRGQVKNQRVELNNRQNYFADLESVQGELLPFAEKLAKVQAALPDNPQLPALYDFLSRSAAFSGLSLRSLSSSVPQRANMLEMRTIPITLELTGSYGALKELLSRLQSSSRMTHVVSLNISDSQEPTRFSLTIQLNAYSY